MPFNPLLPVPVAVEYRPFLEQYPVRVIQERFDDEELQQVTDENGIRDLNPDLLSFRSNANLWQRAAHFNDYSFIFDHGWRESGQVPASIKSNLKLSGTYDLNGEVITVFKEKGIYIDQFS